MTYDRNYLNIEYLFSILGYDEVAATGLKIAGSTPLYNAQGALAALTTAQGQELIAAYVTIFRTIGIRWAEYSQLEGIKVSAVGVDGHYLTDPRVFTQPAPPRGNQGAVLPQATVVASLRSGSTFGKANYGRCYLPHTLMALADGTPYARTPDTAGAAEGVQQWINRVNTVVKVYDPTARVSILSNGAGGPGTTKPVTRVAVDDVVDTQRRRRNQLQGHYAFLPVA